MSFFGLVGGRRNPRRQATVAQTENVSIHAQISPPSRKDSLDSIIRPTNKDRKSSTLPVSRKNSSSSRAKDRKSTLLVSGKGSPSQTSISTLKGKPSEPDAADSFSPILSTTPEGSSSFTLDPIESESASFLSARSASSQRLPRSQDPGLGQNETAASIEHEWTDVGKDSSDEDMFANSSKPIFDPDRITPKLKQSPERSTVIMNEGEKARLANELSTAQRKLAELLDEQTNLQMKILFLEEENKAKSLQIRALEDAARNDRMELLRTHGNETESLRNEIRSLREGIHSLTREGLDKGDKIEKLNAYIAQLRDRAQESEDRLNLAKGDLADITVRNISLQDKCSALEREMKAQSGELGALEQISREKERSLLEAHNAERERMQNEIRNLEQNIQSLTHQIYDKDEGTARLNTEVSGLRAQLKESEEMGRIKSDKLQEELRVTYGTIRYLRESNEKADEEKKSLGREVDIGNGTIQQLREKNKAMMGAAVAEKEKQLEEINQLQRRADDLEQQLSKRDAELQTYANEIKRLDAVSGAVKAEEWNRIEMIEQLRGALKQFEEEKKAVQNRLSILEATNADLKEEVGKAKSTAQDSLRDFENMQESHFNAVTEASAKIRSLEEEVSSYAKVTQELRSLVKTKHAEASAATKEANELRKEVETLKGESIHLRDVLSKHRSEAQENQDRVPRKAFEETIRELNRKIAKLEKENLESRGSTTSMVDEAKEKLRKMEAEVEHTRGKLKEVRRRCEAYEQTRKILQDQLMRQEEERRVRPGESRANVRDVPSPSQDQVHNVLRALNYEIFQTSALLGDSLCDVPRLTSSSPARADDLIDVDTRNVLGDRLLEALAAQRTISDDKYNPLAIQTAIQACLVCCCTRTMTAWYPGYWDFGDFLATTYTRIRGSEGISASDQWRAMTRARFKPNTQTVLVIGKFLMDCLVTIIEFGGWPKENPKIENILKGYREKILSISRLSLRMNVLLDSSRPQLEPVLIEPGIAFDDNVMDSEDSTRPQAEEEVVCTSEIGLRRANQSDARGIVLEPKVILWSSFEA